MSASYPPRRQSPNSSSNVSSFSRAGNTMKRCPAHQSVCLRPSRASESNDYAGQSISEVAVSKSAPPAPVQTPNALPPRLSSRGESATQWFDEANKNVITRQQEDSVLGNDPPFYMSQRGAVPGQSSPSISRVDPHLAQIRRHDSENEDLRSVIDDLTVEIKRLKQRLRKYEKLNLPHLQQDKLFEVRMHGLPPEKIRDLEETLKTFASTLSELSEPASKASPMRDSAIAVSSSSLKKLSLASTSKSQPTDSAYASMSNFLPPSTAHSSKGRSRVMPSFRSQENNIRSYLHNILNTSIPKKPPVLTERATMKIVVRRLEQLFTGRVTAPGEHSQPLQQQEVSRIAEAVDRQRVPELERRRISEGQREARMMPHNSRDGLDASNQEHNMTKSDEIYAEQGVQLSRDKGSSSGQGESPDQRSTRPLDLDIHRAQVPADNIEYIRHLGLSSPKINPVLPGEAEGWVYLNLLVSMAQLHIINVTPEFIRKSVSEMSTKFELSRDGHKVRWKGGTEGTHLTSDSGSPSEATSGSSPENGGFSSELSSKRRKLYHITSHDTSGPGSEIPSRHFYVNQLSQRNTSTIARSGCLDRTTPGCRDNMDNDFNYKPLFFTGRSSDQDDDYLPDNDSLDSLAAADDTPERVYNVNALTSTVSKSSSQQNLPNDGPIIFIFYNSPLFCTDLSGDRRPLLRDANLPSSSDHSGILGISSSRDADSEDLRESRISFSWGRLPPETSLSNDESMETLPDLEDGPNPPALDSKLLVPVELEASGVGGVHPEDNFVIDVRVRRPALEVKLSGRSVLDPCSTGHANPKPFQYDVISAKCKNLAPSALPPPSFIFLPTSSTSSSDEESMLGSDSDEALSSGSIDDDQPAPTAFHRSFSSDSLDEDQGYSGGNETESSMNLLNTARAMDPGIIAAREKEFDSNISHHFAEELSAGSSAATAGGGSGYASE